MYVDVYQFLFCFCNLCIYHNMLGECPYGLPCKRNKAIKRIALASIFARQSIQPWPVCTEHERKHTYRTSEKVCDKAQLYEYKQQDQTQTDKIYLIFSFIKRRQRFKHHLTSVCKPYFSTDCTLTNSSKDHYRISLALDLKISLLRQWSTTSHFLWLGELSLKLCSMWLSLRNDQWRVK